MSAGVPPSSRLRAMAATTRTTRSTAAAAATHGSQAGRRRRPERSGPSSPGGRGRTGRRSRRHHAGPAVVSVQRSRGHRGAGDRSGRSHHGRGVGARRRRGALAGDDRAAVQRVREGARGGEARGRVLGERDADGLAEVLGYVVRQRRRLVTQVRQRRRDRAVGVERPAAGQALVEHHAERVDVARGGGRLALGLLRGEVLRGADHLTGLRQRHRVAGPGDAEVGDLHGAVGGDEQVGGLHVAVHDAQLVGGGHAVGRLGEQVGGGLRGHPLAAPEQRRQRLAPDQLHHQVGLGGAATVRGIVRGARRSRTPTPRWRGAGPPRCVPRSRTGSGTSRRRRTRA